MGSGCFLSLSCINPVYGVWQYSNRVESSYILVMVCAVSCMTECCNTCQLPVQFIFSHFLLQALQLACFLLYITFYFAHDTFLLMIIAIMIIITWDFYMGLLCFMDWSPIYFYTSVCNVLRRKIGKIQLWNAFTQWEIIAFYGWEVEVDFGLRKNMCQTKQEGRVFTHYMCVPLFCWKWSYRNQVI